jgi:hypothetical protein
MDDFDHNFRFAGQDYVIDQLLSDHCKSYAQSIQSQLSLKLSLHSMEANELNLFHLLISTAFDSIIEFTNESLNEKNLIPLSYGVFRCFIGTLLMTSVFNTSVEKSWELMSLCTSNKHMSHERFIQVLTNLRGYDVRRRIINNPNARWIDQRNMLDHLHTLEKKVFEHSIEFFFDTCYGCYVLDDELVGSKANDLENKTISNRKTAGEGTTTDCICDTFFQIVLGIRIKTTADSQLTNVQRLLDYLPQIEDNTMSMLGPIIACDRGYGKKAIIELLLAKNFKVLKIAGTVGSGHPIIGTMVVDQYCSKIREHNSLNCGNSNMENSYGILQT